MYVSHPIFLILVNYLLNHKNQGGQFIFLKFFMLNELLSEENIELKLKNLKKKKKITC